MGVTENQFTIAMLDALKTTLYSPTYPFTDETLIIKRAFSANQDATETAPSLMFNKVRDNNYGHTGRRTSVNEGGTGFVYSEKKIIEAEYDFRARVKVDVSDTEQLTAKDVAEYAASAFQSTSNIRLLKASGIEVLRVKTIPVNYISDEYDQFDALAGFSVTFCYDFVVESTVDVIDSIVPGIHHI